MEKRIDWIDFAKGFTILFVVLFHTLTWTKFANNYFITNFFINYLGLAIATFIMPAFFLISGYLYKDTLNIKDYMCMIYKKASSLLIPYLIFSGILILKHIYRGTTYNPLISVTYVPMDFMWFLYVLFVVFAIFGIMDVLKVNVYGKCFFIFILFLISRFFEYGSVLYLSFIFIPFFFLGYLLKRYINIKRIFNTKGKKFVILLLSLLCLGICKFIFHLNLYNANMSSRNVFTKLLVIIIFIRIVMIFPKNKFYDFMKFTGGYSLVIYLIHDLFIEQFSHFTVFMSNSILGDVIALIITFTVGYVSSLLVIYLCKYKIVNYVFFPRQWMDPLVKKTRFGKWLFSES